MANFYGATALTGGTSGCLDAINGALLSDGDMAMVRTLTTAYEYTLDADSAAAASSPGVISPVTNAGTKRWIRSIPYGIVSAAANLTAGTLIVGDDGAKGVKASVVTVSEAGDIVTPETVRGKNKEVFKTASADSPLTAAECAGTIVSNYGMTAADCTIDLPTAVAGLAFVCILPTVQAYFFKLHCPTAQADKIYLLGVAGSDDGNVGVASGYTTGAACSFFTFKASDGGYDWFAIPLFGVWEAS